MANNSNLNKAKDEKFDEFYTQLSDIENELKYYKEHFKNKVVLCNCDDPYESNFFKYFVLNFNTLKLKKLICTCYDGSPVAGEELNLFNYEEFVSNGSRAYKIEITNVEDKDNDGSITLKDVELILKNKDTAPSLLKGNGDFRSDECISLLKEADIVVTNPPFSEWREFISTILKYNKKFLIIGNLNALKYKDVFPLIKEEKIWLGINHVKEFVVPRNIDRQNIYIDQDGIRKAKFGNVGWFTNLDYNKRHEDLILYKKYNKDEYPFFSTYKAISVPTVKEIPADYMDEMGVPITFLEKHNPDQFEIIGELNHGCDNEYDYAKPIVNGKEIFPRIIIKRKVN